MEVRKFLCNCLSLVLLFLITARTSLAADQAGFAIRRGVNISHWLSQSGRRGEERKTFFTEKDVQLIKTVGYDHIRLPVDEEQLWDENGNRHDEAFALLHEAIRWCRQQDLRVVVDLHTLRSHHFNAAKRPLWTDPGAQDHFVRLWTDLSSALKEHPVDRVAYELMNEPVADDPEVWNRLVERTVKEIRKAEPDRKIVIGSNQWQSVRTFDQLRIPEGDRNIILSFHFYIPMLVTHYRASWTGVGRYRGPVNYPGQIVDPSEIEDLPEDMARIVKNNNGVYNREVFLELIQEPLRVARKHDLPLYCGEWGCFRATPRGPRLAWYEDVRSILEENGIAWANWDYKGGFAIVGRDGQVDEELMRTLIPRKVPADPFVQNRKLGRGVNIIGYDPIWRSPDRARFQERYFRIIRDAGFDTVRINLHPFRHMDRSQEFALPDAWWKVLDWAIENARQSDLMAILDLHEFNTMGRDPEGNKERFLAFWSQVAGRLKDAPDTVVFEILNEPSRQLTAQLWDQYFREALAIIRKENPTRTVIIGPPHYNSIGHLGELHLPEADRHIIVTVHYYSPMEFTHQGAPWAGEHKDRVGVAWLGTDEEKKAIRDDFERAQAWAREHNRPLFLGEFGAYDKGDMDSRARYTACVARTAEELGWSWAYWQFDSDFIVYDIDKDRWVEPIRRALIPAP